MGPPPPPTPPTDPSSAEPPYVEAPHFCEGDEDICEPSADIGYPGLDVLATWSRIEGDEFVLQVRFRGTTLMGRNHGALAILVDEAGRNGALDVRSCSNVDVAPCTLWELGVYLNEWDVYDASGVIGLIWPPRDLLVAHAVVPNQGIYDMEYLGGMVRYALEGTLVEVRLPMLLVSADGTAPQYSLMVNYTNDGTLGDEGHMPATSLGGRMDDVEPQLPTTFYYLDFWVSGG